MERNDAIELIRRHVYELRGEVNFVEFDKYGLIKALEDFAIPAIEKGIARDLAVEVGISRREYYACPNCTDFIKWRFDVNRDNYEPSICPSCGQALNWRR